MYLNMLNRREKHLFLALEIYISEIDGDFSDEEKQIINAHCLEMGIDNNNFELRMEVEEILKEIEGNLDDTKKHIFFLELAGTVLADNIYYEKERQIMERLANILKIKQGEIDEAFSIIKDLKSVYLRCAKYVS